MKFDFQYLQKINLDVHRRLNDAPLETKDTFHDFENVKISNPTNGFLDIYIYIYIRNNLKLFIEKKNIVLHLTKI